MLIFASIFADAKQLQELCPLSYGDDFPAMIQKSQRRDARSTLISSP